MTWESVKKPPPKKLLVHLSSLRVFVTAAEIIAATSSRRDTEATYVGTTQGLLMTHTVHVPFRFNPYVGTLATSSVTSIRKMM